MKYPVIRKFTCKLDKKRYKPGDTYETSDPERAAFLQQMDRIGEAPPEAAAVEPVHIGGGWYELPGGERVKGKKAALEAIAGGD